MGKLTFELGTILRIPSYSRIDPEDARKVGPEQLLYVRESVSLLSTAVDTFMAEANEKLFVLGKLSFATLHIACLLSVSLTINHRPPPQVPLAWERNSACG
jgi:hypothetical protein